MRTISIVPNLLIVLAVLLRGPLFRLCFHFQNLRERSTGASLSDPALGHFSETVIDPGVSTCIDEAISDALGFPDVAPLRMLLAQEPTLCLVPLN